MEKWEIRPPPQKKNPNRSSQKFPQLIRSGIHTPMQNFITIRLPLFVRRCENVHQVTRLVFWFFRHATAKTPAPICQMTSFRARMCLLGSRKQKKIYFEPHFPQRKWLHANKLRPYHARVQEVLVNSCSIVYEVDQEFGSLPMSDTSHSV